MQPKIKNLLVMLLVMFTLVGTITAIMTLANLTSSQSFVNAWISSFTFAFLVLSMLYPDLKIDQIQFHQDHMHPHSKFKHANLKSIAIEDNDIANWLELRDQLPNLQLLEGGENTQKQATNLDKWVEEKIADERDYRERN